MLCRTLLSSVHIISISITISVHAGQFPDSLIVRVERDGRNLTLINDFRFIDDDKRTWTTPAGSVVDGASIPKPLWSLIGGPLEGKYREASVIHDYYCVIRSRPWDQVHKVFYDAMLANGVAMSRAMVMYLAVYRFGPRWDLDYTRYYCPPGHACARATENDSKEDYYLEEFTPRFNKSQFDQIEKEVKSWNLSDANEVNIQIEEYKGELDESFTDDVLREISWRSLSEIRAQTQQAVQRQKLQEAEVAAIRISQVAKPLGTGSSTRPETLVTFTADVADTVPDRAAVLGAIERVVYQLDERWFVDTRIARMNAEERFSYQLRVWGSTPITAFIYLAGEERPICRTGWISPTDPRPLTEPAPNVDIECLPEAKPQLQGSQRQSQ